MTTSSPLPLTGGLTAHGQTAGTLATSCGRSRVVPGALPPVRSVPRATNRPARASRSRVANRGRTGESVCRSLVSGRRCNDFSCFRCVAAGRLYGGCPGRPIFMGATARASHISPTRRSVRHLEVRVWQWLKDRRNGFQKGQSMGQTKAPVTLAVERGDLALRAYDDAWANGEMDRDERQFVRSLLLDWFATTKAARNSVMTGLAFMKGIETEAYQNRLVAEYRESLDELPGAA